MNAPNSLAAAVVTAPAEIYQPTRVETPRFSFLNDPIHERMRSNPFYGKRIQLRSANGKFGQPVHIEPTHARGYDNRWLGIPSLTPDEKQRSNFPLAVPGETYVKVPDGYEIDCGTEEGLYQWEWLQHAPQLVSDTDKFDPEKPHEGADKELYVFVPALEEERRAKQLTDRIDAGNYIRSVSPKKWYDVARLLGSNMENATEYTVYNYLLDVADKRPKDILGVRDDAQADQKLLVKRLLDRGIIRQEEGTFKYNQMFLGTTEQQVLLFISQAQHQDVVQYMRNALGVGGGLVPTPVSTSYASYNQVPQQVQQQASAPSTVLNAPRPTNAPAAATTTGTDLSNEDLGDDYQEHDPTADESATDTTATTTTAPPAATAPNRPAATGTRPPVGGKSATPRP
jgi:hypothetical protein